MNCRPLSPASRFTCTTDARVRHTHRLLSQAALGLSLLLGLSLAGCGEDAGHGQWAGSASAPQAIASSEASAPLNMRNAEPGDAASAAPGTAGAASTEGDRNKDTAPRRIERQMGEIADASPGGFRLGSIKVVIDGSTVVEPSNAITEGEPVDVTGYYESDRKTLRATLVRSTRPAAPQPAEQASETPGLSSG